MRHTHIATAGAGPIGANPRQRCVHATPIESTGERQGPCSVTDYGTESASPVPTGLVLARIAPMGCLRGDWRRRVRPLRARRWRQFTQLRTSYAGYRVEFPPGDLFSANEVPQVDRRPSGRGCKQTLNQNVIDALRILARWLDMNRWRALRCSRQAGIERKSCVSWSNFSC